MGVAAYDPVIAEFFACVTCEASEVLSDTSLSCLYLTRTVMELVKCDCFAPLHAPPTHPLNFVARGSHIEGQRRCHVCVASPVLHNNNSWFIEGGGGVAGDGPCDGEHNCEVSPCPIYK